MIPKVWLFEIFYLYLGDFKIAQIMDNKIINKSWGFISNGKPYLETCPKCKRENYAPNVSLGICTWCGLDMNDKLNIKKYEKI